MEKIINKIINEFPDWNLDKKEIIKKLKNKDKTLKFGSGEWQLNVEYNENNKPIKIYEVEYNYGKEIDLYEKNYFN